MWDRSKQNYWISRGETWKVVDMKTNKVVCECPQFYDNGVLELICFAANEESVKNCVKEIPCES